MDEESIKLAVKRKIVYYIINTCHIYDKKKINPMRVIWVNPNSIIYDKKEKMMTPKERIYSYIESGDWDMNLPSYSDKLLYRLLRKRYEYGYEYEETEEYKYILSLINKNGEFYRKSKSEKELKRRLRLNDKLYEKILKDGFQTPPGINFGVSGVPNTFTEQIKISIGRSGHYVFETGNHRLSISKILNLNLVPVQVTRRHTIWQNFRDEIINEKDKTSRYKIADTFKSHPDIEYLLTFLIMAISIIGIGDCSQCFITDNPILKTK